jgi:hypothetical protein
MAVGADTAGARRAGSRSFGTRWERAVFSRPHDVSEASSAGKAAEWEACNAGGPPTRALAGTAMLDASDSSSAGNRKRAVLQGSRRVSEATSAGLEVPDGEL